MRNVHYGLSLLLVIISSLAGLNLLFHRHHSNPGDPIASEDELKSKEGDDDVSLDRSLPLKHETTAKYLDVLAYEFELNESQLISFSQTSYFLKQLSYYK